MGMKMSKNNGLIHVVIPAYNEEKKVEQVIADLKRLKLDLKILVIDDGSKDNTMEKAKESGATVIRHLVNLGQWAALKTGFIVALLDDAETIVTIDADGQHDPNDLVYFLEMMKNEDVDIIIGSRFLDEPNPEMPLYRKLGIKFFNKIINFLTKYKVTDCTSGYKLFKADLIKKTLSTMNEMQYGSLDFLLKSAKLGASLKEIPIKSKTNSQSNKGSIRYGYNLIRTILKEL